MRHKIVFKYIFVFILFVFTFCLSTDRAYASNVYTFNFSYFENADACRNTCLAMVKTGGASFTYDVCADNCMDKYSLNFTFSKNYLNQLLKENSCGADGKQNCGNYFKNNYCKNSSNDNKKNFCNDVKSGGSSNNSDNTNKTCAYQFITLDGFGKTNLNTNSYGFSVNFTKSKVNSITWNSSSSNVQVADSLNAVTSSQPCTKFGVTDNVCFIGAGSFDKFQNEFLNAYNNGLGSRGKNQCPMLLIGGKKFESGNGQFLWHVGVYDDKNKKANFTYSNLAQVTVDGDSNIVSSNLVEDPPIKEFKFNYQDFNTCEDVLGSSILNTINDWFLIIKILIPVLLIAFGFLDFGKAVLASDENKMKESQKRFVKRLVIAVLIFMVPTIVSLLLDLGNMAWNGSYDASICGLR